jgi:hypothetical protein
VADVKTAYRASSNLTVTALNGGIASSTTFVAGWTSATIDNSTNKDLDLLLSGKFVAESSGLTAGQIRVYVYVPLDDSNYPDLFSAGTEGTEGTCTLHDTELLDHALYLVWSAVTDTSASRVYNMPQTSLLTRLGFVPQKCAVYVTHSMVAALETSGNQVTVTGIYGTVA